MGERSSFTLAPTFTSGVSVACALAVSTGAVTGCGSRVNLGAFAPDADGGIGETDAGATEPSDATAPRDGASDDGGICAPVEGGVSCATSLASFCGTANSVCADWGVTQSAPVCPSGFLDTMASGPCGGFLTVTYYGLGLTWRTYYYDPVTEALLAVASWDTSGASPVTTCLGGPACFVPSNEYACNGSATSARCTYAPD